MLARRNGLVRIWLLFIFSNCDIWWQTDIKAAVTDTEAPAQLHRLPVSVSHSNTCMKDWMCWVSSQLLTWKPGNASRAKKSSMARLDGRPLTDSLPAIIHAETAGCYSVFSHTLAPLPGRVPRYTLLRFPIQTSGWWKSLMIHWAMSFCAD